jgi:hypothetical protein
MRNKLNAKSSSFYLPYRKYFLIAIQLPLFGHAFC